LQSIIGSELKDDKLCQALYHLGKSTGSTITVGAALAAAFATPGAGAALIRGGGTLAFVAEGQGALVLEGIGKIAAATTFAKLVSSKTHMI